MTLTTVPITGRVVLPDDSAFTAGVLTFTLSDVDTELQQVIPTAGLSCTLDGDDMPAAFALWSNTAGERGTSYSVKLTATVATNLGGGQSISVRKEYNLGSIQVGGAASYTIGELLRNPVGDAEDWARQVRFFATRAAFVTWAAASDPATGTVIEAGGYSYRYIGTGTAIADLPGWVPNGQPAPDHWAENITPGTTDMSAAVASYLAYLADGNYKTSAVVSVPPRQDATDVRLTGAASPMVRVRQADTLVTGSISQTGEGFGVLLDAAIDGYRIQDMNAESDGWIVYAKTSLGTGGYVDNGIVSGMSIHGLTDLAKIGIGWDGDARNGLAYGNIIRDLQRNDASGRPAHAYAIAGEAGDIPVNNCESILVALSVIDDVNGNGAHFEDANSRTGSAFLLMRNVQRGIEVINDNVPYLQYHIGHMIGGWSLYAIDNVGTGHSEQMTWADMLIDGAGLAQVGPAMRVNQSDTNGIVFDRMHIRNLPDDGLECTAQGRVTIDHSTFFSVSGNALVGRATAPVGRGLYVTSRNSFQTVGAIIEKANSANLMGDQVASAFLVSDVAHTEIMLHAKRPGFLSKVTLTVDDTVFASGANAVFSIIKRTSAGVETVMIDNTIPRGNAAYQASEWTAENVQITAHEWATGDLILAQCDGTGGTSRSATVQIEYFEYN